MARILQKISFVVEVPYIAGVAQTPKLGQVNYSLAEETDETMRRHSGVHKTDTPPVPRELSGTDLLQSVQQAFVEIETQVKAKEGLI